MSQLNMRELLSISVSAIKQKLKIDSFTWGEYEEKLQEAMEGAEVITYPEVPFTCTEDGMSEGIYCSCCNTWLKEREVISAHHVDENGDNICDACGEKLTLTIASGSCGTDLTWDLHSDYTLYISGTSEMANYDSEAAAPWNSYRSQIKAIKVISGKSIGDNAFSNCTNLKTVDFGKQIVTIGYRAFYYCKNITTITLLGTTKEIQDYAFSECSGISAVNFSNSLESVGQYAFNKCTSLTSLNFPASLTSFGRSVFYYCSALNLVDFSKHTTIPSLGSQYVFQGTASDLVIKVPSALLDEWKAADKWSTLSDKIVGV